MPLLVVSANDIDVAGLQLDVHLPVVWLTAELLDTTVAAVASGHLTARLSRTGSDVVVRGRVKTSVTTPCARCLSPTPVEVDAELSLLLRPAPKAALPPHGRGRTAAENGAPRKGARGKEPEYEFTSDEADLDTYDGDTVVLDAFVREAILLEMPNFPLCSEACPGIGPAAFAGDLGRDPPTRAGGNRERSSPDDSVEEDREGGSLDPVQGEAEAASPPSLDPRLAPLRALRDKLVQKPPGASKERAQSAESSPVKSGTPKKKTKKE